MNKTRKFMERAGKWKKDMDEEVRKELDIQASFRGDDFGIDYNYTGILKDALIYAGLLIILPVALFIIGLIM